MKRIVCEAVAVVGTALLLGSIVVAARQDPATASAPREIEVVAKRFAFEPAHIEVTEGERIRLLVRSADGVHGFEIKKLQGQQGRCRVAAKPVVIDFVAAAPGTYEILCSEECGDGHETMKGTLVVQAKPKAHDERRLSLSRRTFFLFRTCANETCRLRCARPS